MAVIGGIRQYNAWGTKNSGSTEFSQQMPGWFAAEYNKTIGPAVSQSPSAFTGGVIPVYYQRFQWYTFYNNSSIKPSLADAANPDSGIYRWSTGPPGAVNGNGFLYDPITEALSSSLIQNGAGVAKLIFNLSLTATSGSYNPPLWMRASTNYAWEETTGGANSVPGLWHIRYDNQEVVNHVVAFVTAVLVRYGANEGIHSIALGEYFTGNSALYPPGFSRNGHAEGAASTWAPIVAAAPVTNGARVNIVQTNPMIAGTATPASLYSAGIGVTSADAELGFGSNFPEELEVFDQFRANEPNLHLSINNDARSAIQGTKKSWANAPSNPFGHSTSYNEVATLPELAWFNGDGGRNPTHTFLATIRESSIQNTAAFLDAVRRFGINGTDAATWGVTPKLLVQSSISGGSYIVGAPVSGVLLTYGHSIMSDQGAITITGQEWTRNGVLGWDGTTFSLNDTHEGEYLGIRVYYTDGFTSGYRDAPVIGPITTVPNYAPQGSVFLTGNTSVGSKLTPSNNLTDQNGRVNAVDIYTYFWDNGVQVGSGDHYTVTEQDAGVRIRARDQYTDDDGYINTVYSAYVFIPPSGPIASNTVSIVENSGILTAIPDINDADSALGFEWYRTTQPIVGIDNNVYKWILADVGHDIYVHVLYTGTDGMPKQVISSPYGPIKNPLKGSDIMLDKNAWQKEADLNVFPSPDGAPEGAIRYRDMNNVVRELQAVEARDLADKDGTLAMTGPANVYAVQLNASTYTTVNEIKTFRASVPVTNNSNTITVNPNGVGNIPVLQQDLNPVPPGGLVAGGIYDFTKTSDDSAYLVNIASASSNIIVGTDIGNVVPVVDVGGGLPGLPAIDISLATGFPPGTGTVDNVVGGTGITVTGTVANPVINADSIASGVQSITSSDSSVTISGTVADPDITFDLESIPALYSGGVATATPVSPASGGLIVNGINGSERVLTSSDLVLLEARRHRSVATTKQNSTLTTDPSLSGISLKTSTSYALSAYVVLASASGSSGAQVKFDGPWSAGSISHSYEEAGGGNGGNGSSDPSLSQLITLSAGIDKSVFFCGVVTTDSSANPVANFQWAQGTTNPVVTVFRANSYVIYTELP